MSTGRERGSDPQVFCVGFHRTGTSSLGAALRMLGFRVCGSVATHDPEIATRVRAIARSLLDEYDAFQDNPWPILYRELDEWRPGSRFILTTRPTDAWIRSVVRFFGANSTPMREWIYGAGSPLGSEERYRTRFERHNADVMRYFRDRPGDLLVLRITEGEGWPELCRFLGLPVPSEPFPHLVPSRGSGARRPLARLARYLKRGFRG